MEKRLARGVFAAALLLIYGSASIVLAETLYVPKVPRGWVGTAVPTLQAAVSLAADGDEIVIVSGAHAGAEIVKRLTIRGLLKNGRKMASISTGRGGLPPVAHTDVGPLTAGLILRPGSEGTVIRDLKFARLDLPIYGAGASEVSVLNCEIAKPVQGITVWDGGGWTVEGNVIRDLVTKGGGGLGIVIGSREAGAVGNELIGNRVHGRLTIAKRDVGRFIGAGLALIAEVGADKASGIRLLPEVAETLSAANTIDVTARPAESKTTRDPYFCGIMLNQLNDEPLSGCYIHDNRFASTFFGRTVYRILENPEGVDNCYNVITNGTSLLAGEIDVPPRSATLPVRPF
ncbi:MAG: hypothetical protein MUF52_16930 [Syntrophobacteraceae bacterium]|jgi:hypothetical protein|nr:hypothetical protein [Syntrophobacteraceae bacterium]